MFLLIELTGFLAVLILLRAEDRVVVSCIPINQAVLDHSASLHSALAP